MKKYRLKEEAYKYFPKELVEYEFDLEYWTECYDITPEALEEVPQRIELEIWNLGSGVNGRLQKKTLDGFTKEEKELCEKALNGELFTEDDMHKFAVYWGQASSWNFDLVLKQWKGEQR